MNWLKSIQLGMETLSFYDNKCNSSDELPPWMRDYFLYMLAFISLHLITYLLYYPFIVYMNWEHTTKQLTDHYSDLLYCLFLSIILFFFGDYYFTFDYLTVVSSILGTLGFGALDQVSFLKNDLSDWKKWSWKAWCVYLTALILILLSAGYHIFLSVECDIELSYLLAVSIPIVGGILAFIAATHNSPPITFHPHHWFIFYSLSFFTRFPTVISKISAGICIGIYIQALTTYAGATAFF